MPPDSDGCARFVRHGVALQSFCMVVNGETRSFLAAYQCSGPRNSHAGQTEGEHLQTSEGSVGLWKPGLDETWPYLNLLRDFRNRL